MRRLLGLLFVVAWGVSSYAADPFKVMFSQTSTGSNLLVSVSVSVPRDHHIYADQIEARLEGGSTLPQVSGDKPSLFHDAQTESDCLAFSRDFRLVFNAGNPDPSRTVLMFSYQGCNEQECFFPKTLSYDLRASATGTEAVDSGGRTDHPDRWTVPAGSHVVAARASGYMNSADFLAFLDSADGKIRDAAALERTIGSRIKAGFLLFGANPVEFLKVHGVWWTVLVILIGGLLLNLTPCVLPMIPINLAILGVGAQNSTRSRGFLLGSCYGTGIALVYGVLGLVVVLTGSQFGTLNSMPWFNAVIGFVFVVLALAMFDVFAIDLSRFQSAGTGTGGQGRGRVVTAFFMGGVAALLAGACVAPVVIAVLLLSGNLYASGAGIGLVLPFLLGLGMALPWPLAGAGLSFLPKPGRWMTWVKYGFGVFILLFALYYFFLAYQGWRGGVTSRQSVAGVYDLTPADHGRWAQLLRESAVSGKPVLVDFWATWCKNCEAMELTTFKDPDIQNRLSGYTVVKFQAEKPADPDTRGALEAFEVKGLPTYLVIKPVGRKTLP